jgi:hypothetical protein
VKTDEKEGGDDVEGAIMPSRDAGPEHDDTMMFTSHGTNPFPIQNIGTTRPFKDVFPPYEGIISLASTDSHPGRRYRHQTLSTTTLDPIDDDPPVPVDPIPGIESESTTPPDLEEIIPALAQITLQPAARAGVFAWAPLSGPVGCKFLIHIRHTSSLAVKIFYSNQSHCWIDFDGNKVPAIGHVYFHNALFSDNNPLGQNREVLLALVPECARTQVPISLYVQDENGAVVANMPLGWFRIDANSMVPAVIC